MKKCSKCDITLDDGFFCPECGSALIECEVKETEEKKDEAPESNGTPLTTDSDTKKSVPFPEDYDDFAAPARPSAAAFTDSGFAAQNDNAGANMNNAPQTAQNYYSQPQTAAPVSHISLGEYLLMFFVSVLPVAGLVMLFVWAFDTNDKPERRNFAIAILIWKGVKILFAFLIYMLMFSMMIGFISTVVGNFV